ncbi:GtrA family protein [Patescibacteria group bacterium]|nr:GtrA family protein [Patescibacteria group bacterium]
MRRLSLGGTLIEARKKGEFGRYFVGILVAGAVYLGTYFLLKTVYGVEKKHSSAFALLAYYAVTFVTQKFYAFREMETKTMWIEIGKFILASLGYSLASYKFTALTLEHLHYAPLAQFVFGVLCLPLNFRIARKIFTPKEKGDDNIGAALP